MVDTVPTGFEPFARKDGYLGLIGPLYLKTDPLDRVLGLRADERHANPVGIVHGGVLVSLIDVTMGEAASARTDADDFFLTLGIDCHFAEPARIGDWIEGRAEITRIGKSIAHLRGTLTTRDRVLLTGSAIFKSMARPGGAQS